MDAFFNAYKARYELLDNHFDQIQRTQHINSIDIFINLDDMLHKLHRPNVEHEFELCGIEAPNQCTSNIINIAAHYKMWAAKRKYPCRVFLIYTSSRGHFKNSMYVLDYRKHFGEITDLDSMKFSLVNSAVNKSILIAKSICNYVTDVHMIDSLYLEPSIIPWFLKEETEVVNYHWSILVSRDNYDLQYAYKDRWTFVSPKGDNTRMVTRSNLWKYIGDREHVEWEKFHTDMYHHDLFPLAITVVGDRYRNIPRLKRIGWKTVFKYLDEITAESTISGNVIVNRFLELLQSKGVPSDSIQSNFNVTSVASQVATMTPIMKTGILNQMRFVSDLDALTTINEVYFSKFPINIPFLTASHVPIGVFGF